MKGSLSLFQSIPVNQLKICQSAINREQCDVDDCFVTDIKEKGLLQPLCVRASPIGNFFEVYAGKRRLEALRRLGATHAVCRVEENISDADVQVASIAENLSQRPMTLGEQCAALHKVIKMCKVDAEEAARRTSASNATLKAYLRMMGKLSPTVKEQLDDGKVPIETAVALAKSGVSKEDQESAIEERGASVDAITDYIQEKKESAPKKKRAPKGPWVYDENGDPLPIPEKLYKKVLTLVRREGSD
jgi:ParB family chromosome partitioning protein